MCASVSTDNGQTSRLSIFYCVSNHKKFIPKYLRRSYKFRLNFTNIEAANGRKSSRKRFWKSSSQCREILPQAKQLIASFRCYANSDVVAALIIRNFHLYLIQLWWQFFTIFVYGDVVYAQTWEVLILKNCIEPPYRPAILESPYTETIYPRVVSKRVVAL